MLISAIASLILVLAGGTPSKPTFDAYPAAKPSGRSASKLDFRADPRARRFRTQLERALGRPANFAGHYVVVDWGCGSSCQAVGLVDVDTGVARLTISTGLGSEYRADSRLFIDSPEAAVRDACPGQPCIFSTRYFVWEEKNKAFQMLDEGGRAAVGGGTRGP